MTTSTSTYVDSKDIVFLLNDGSNLQNISANITGHSFPAEWNYNDITTYGSVGRRWAPSIDQTTFTLDMLFNQVATSGTHTVVGTMFYAHATRAFAFYPATTTSGSLKISGNCVCNKYEIVGKVGNAETVRAEFKVDNSCTFGTAT